MSSHVQSSSASSLNDLIASLGLVQGAKPPVHTWNPQRCGDIGMEIRADGAWYHEGTPIQREALVRLFASILRKDHDGYWLVTPAEKVLVKVEDVPFTVVRVDSLQESGRPAWGFTTNVGDVVAAGPEHPLRLRLSPDGLALPYVEIRAGLEAKLLRGPYYELVQAAQEQEGVYGIESLGVFFPLQHKADA